MHPRPHHTLRRSPSYGNLWHKSKTKIFNFRWGLFYIKLQNSTKNYPSNPPFQHQQLCICALTQKFTPTFFFASSNTFQNCMSWSRSTNSHGGDSLQGKGLDAAPVLQGEDWTQVLPTQYLPGTNQTSPENFIQICPTIQKLFFNWANSGLFFVYFRIFKQTL